MLATSSDSDGAQKVRREERYESDGRTMVVCR